MVKHLVIYVHGKGGNANEAEHYKPFFAESDVIGFDYQAQNPWEAQKEFSSFFEVHSQVYDSVTLIDVYKRQLHWQPWDTEDSRRVRLSIGC